jgi:hypothetical protein
MKHFLSGVAVVATLAVSIPAWAQGNAGEAPSTSTETSAMPAKHRHVRTVHPMAHGGAAMHTRASQTSGNSSANQLNEQELSRLQAGTSMGPSTMGGPGPASSTMAGPGTMSSSRSLGPKASGSGYAPSEPGAGAAPPAAGPAAAGPGAGGPR